MKHAISDLNMTVVIIVAIAGLVAFFGGIVWPSIKSHINTSANCNDAICLYENCNVDNGTCQCYMAGKESQMFECPFKG